MFKSLYAVALGVPIYLLSNYIYDRLFLHVATPNQWLIVIRDGKQIKAGVGLRYYASRMDTVVTMPASVFKVPFQAQQVTKEMQGVEVGFLIPCYSTGR
jgi:hypothetical protein